MATTLDLEQLSNQLLNSEYSKILFFLNWRETSFIHIFFLKANGIMKVAPVT